VSKFDRNIPRMRIYGMFPVWHKQVATA